MEIEEEDKATYERHHTLCTSLNMDKGAAEEAWKSYVAMRQNYTLEVGNPVNFRMKNCSRWAVLTVGIDPSNPNLEIHKVRLYRRSALCISVNNDNGNIDKSLEKEGKVHMLDAWRYMVDYMDLNPR